MKENPLIGRHSERTRLQSHLESRKSEFVAIYGRRRVGKTFLVRKTFGDQLTFYLTGLANAKMQQQLLQFHHALLTYRAQPTWEPVPPTNWLMAFRLLSELLDQYPMQDKKVVFLDELPWLDTMHSNFLTGLEYFWNAWASARDDILLITCGSAAGWMLNKLIRNRGGLHNRVTDRIKLEPFDLGEMEQFLIMKNAAYDRYQILQLYMVFGGIPFYLDLIDPGLSANQNINQLCFAQNAPFRDEYQNLYRSLFHKHDRHLAIVSALSSKGKGLTRSEISQITKLANGGGLTRLLAELEESNFIRRYRSFGKKERDSLYQLLDPYSLFYLKFIIKTGRDDDNYWTNLLDSPSYYNWAGYAFEITCLQHITQIKRALGISAVQTSVSTWHSAEAQIDLLIDRKDQVINLCELKFSLQPYAINKKYAENLRNKLSSFREYSKTRKSLFLTFITTYGLAQSKYSGMVQNDLDMDVLFH